MCSLASAANNEVIDNSPAAFPSPPSMVVRPATGAGVPKEGRGERDRLVYHQVPLLFRPPHATMRSVYAWAKTQAPTT